MPKLSEKEIKIRLTLLVEASLYKNDETLQLLDWIKHAHYDTNCSH